MPKITDLPSATPLTGSEVLPIVQAGRAKSATTNNLLTLFATIISGLVETRTVKNVLTDGFTWILNGGASVHGVTKIYIQGVLQNNNDFTITLATGTVVPLFTISGNVRVDIFWV